MNRRDFLKTAAALGSAGIVLSGPGAWMTRAFADSENRQSPGGDLPARRG